MDAENESRISAVDELVRSDSASHSERLNDILEIRLGKHQVSWEMNASENMYVNVDFYKCSFPIYIDLCYVMTLQKTLEAFNELSTFLHENTLNSRRTLRSKVEKRGIGIIQVLVYVHHIIFSRKRE